MKLEVTHKATTFSFILDYPVKDCSERSSLPGPAEMANNLYASANHAAFHLVTRIQCIPEPPRGRVGIVAQLKC